MNATAVAIQIALSSPQLGDTSTLQNQNPRPTISMEDNSRSLPLRGDHGFGGERFDHGAVHERTFAIDDFMSTPHHPEGQYVRNTGDGS